MVISHVIGHKEWMANYNTPAIIGVGVLFTTATIHGTILLLTNKG